MSTPNKEMKKVFKRVDKTEPRSIRRIKTKAHHKAKREMEKIGITSGKQWFDHIVKKNRG